MTSRAPTHRLLHVDSSLNADNSVTRKLSAALVEQWRRANPGVAVTYRDLATDPIAHLSSSALQTSAIDAAGLSEGARNDSKLTG